MPLACVGVELHELQAVFQKAAEDEGLTATFSRTSDGYLRADLRLADVASERSAVLSSNGVELFMLDLDDRYSLPQFEYVVADQALMLRGIAGIAGVHLRGGSVPAMEERGWGRQPRSCLDIRWDGETYRARARR